MIFPHRVLEGAEEGAVINNVTAMIPTLNKAGTKDRWETGWGEILEAYQRTSDIASLRPQYIRPNQPVRLNGKFVMPEDPDIEAKWYEFFFGRITQEWLAKHDEIWEYGCGSGWNVATLALAFPNKAIVGADWSEASNKIVAALRPRFRNVFPSSIDFFSPPTSGLKPTRAAVFTVGAMEQTGTSWRPFFEYLLAAKPAVVVHIEPILDWYDSTSPIDRTAIMAHKERGFWEGFPAELRRREGMGEVEILHTERTGFGSLFIEGYSQLIWKPR